MGMALAALARPKKKKTTSFQLAWYLRSLYITIEVVCSTWKSESAASNILRLRFNPSGLTHVMPTATLLLQHYGLLQVLLYSEIAHMYRRKGQAVRHYEYPPDMYFAMIYKERKYRMPVRSTTKRGSV